VLCVGTAPAWRRRVRTFSILSVVVFTACGSPVGPGSLRSAPSVTGRVGAPVTVPFQVDLFCDRAAGPMEFIAGVAGRVTSPDGGVSQVTPTFKVQQKSGFECTDISIINTAFIDVVFTPDAPGSWRADIDVTPKEVGSFSQTIQVVP